ncbi:MAG: hypothetical protein M1826_005620 [Phylliscum demangeonii]|nr:MAG: hypothetical protein M1826_005620 [Phylliscum demangeonii]
MQLSWHHLALLGATAGVVVAVLPPQFTYKAIVDHVRQVVAEERAFRDILEAARALPAEEQAQAVYAWKEAMRIVDARLDMEECKESDVSPPRPEPGSPGHNALDKVKEDGLYKVLQHGPPAREPPRPEARGPGIGPPSARDSWAKEKPYHIPLKVDWLA